MYYLVFLKVGGDRLVFAEQAVVQGHVGSLFELLQVPEDKQEPHRVHDFATGDKALDSWPHPEVPAFDQVNDDAKRIGSTQTILRGQQHDLAGPDFSLHLTCRYFEGRVSIGVPTALPRGRLGGRL